MLNITEISISSKIDTGNYSAFRILERRSGTKWLIKILLVLFLIFIITLFLPWTQNIRSKGYVTTLNPYDKPQNIQALIGGKIDKWYVKEGDLVSIGDTILILKEAKEDYLDPQLIENTINQQMAKSKSAEAYLTKRQFLSDQLVSLVQNLESKLRQIKIKQDQVTLKMSTLEFELEAADIELLNATNQLDRMQIMFEKGIKPLKDMEDKQLKKRKANAKKTSVLNKIEQAENDRLDLLQEIELANNDYEQKVQKIESEIRTADSYRYSLLGETNKLQSKVNQLEQRRSGFVITSPIAGRITKILKNGIGEYVKAQESIATIVPEEFQKAVELYVSPTDMPLIQKGEEVRILFDGWPAVVFSGWPQNSVGTFGGRVFAIDNDISDNGRYRILVVEDGEEKPWPELIRIGSGARGLLLLNDVKVYYELWRKLNGFPPDFYNQEQNEAFKNKAPIRKFK
ncbi:MAG: HlyD family secretion protein [Bacteroidia bacterium]|nr:HlyD family secretion protein [Bacteroidia bacterium]